MVTSISHYDLLLLQFAHSAALFTFSCTLNLSHSLASVKVSILQKLAHFKSNSKIKCVQVSC